MWEPKFSLGILEQ